MVISGRKYGSTTGTDRQRNQQESIAVALVWKYFMSVVRSHFF